jgi:uncharacterized membrane protein YfcA
VLWLLGLDVSLQGLDVGWHFLLRLAADDERDEQSADAVPVEVDRDGQPGTGFGQGFHGDVDGGADGSVDALHSPCPGCVDAGYLGGDGPVGPADAAGGQALGAHLRGAGRVEAAVDDALLPFVEECGVCGVGEHLGCGPAHHGAGDDRCLVLIAGTPPGVIAGSIIRVELLPSPRVFDLVVAAVLLPLGAWLALTRPARPGPEPRPPARAVPPPVLILFAVVVGCVGGIYGIGGGSILAPILIGTGRPPREVAPAALASTFVTSVAGVITFLVLSAHHHGSVAPDWPTGIALGIGGRAGAYTGARIQQRLPDTLIRRVMGVLVVAIGARYLWSGLG